MKIQSSVNQMISSIGGVSLSINKEIAKLAMDRMKTQRDSKIAQKTNITGGNDGSQIT